MIKGQLETLWPVSQFIAFLASFRAADRNRGHDRLYRIAPKGQITTMLSVPKSAKVHQRDGGDGAVRPVEWLFENLKHTATSFHLVTDNDCRSAKFDAFFQRTFLRPPHHFRGMAKYANGKRSRQRYVATAHEIILLQPTAESAIPLFSRKPSSRMNVGRHHVDRWTDEAKRLSWTLRLHCLPRPYVPSLNIILIIMNFVAIACRRPTAEESERNWLRFAQKCAIKNSTLYKKHHEQFMEDECSTIPSWDQQGLKVSTNSWPSFFPRTANVWTNHRKWARTMLQAAGLQPPDRHPSRTKFFHLPELGCADDDINFLFRSDSKRKTPAWDAKITNTRTLYKKLREGRKPSADNEPQ
jgi:hypothetical protein